MNLWSKSSWLPAVRVPKSISLTPDDRTDQPTAPTDATTSEGMWCSGPKHDHNMMWGVFISPLFVLWYFFIYFFLPYFFLQLDFFSILDKSLNWWCSYAHISMRRAGADSLKQLYNIQILKKSATILIKSPSTFQSFIFTICQSMMPLH